MVKHFLVTILLLSFISNSNALKLSVSENGRCLVKEDGGTSTWFHNKPWLDFKMRQTGHCADQGTYMLITHGYNLSPTKPVLDGEPLYEDHPNCSNAKELGHSIPEDIRRIMYWNVFAGAFGQTYGCHDVWQMYTLEKEPINQPLRPWPEALDLPMASQVKHLKNLMLSRRVLTRIPDQAMLIDTQTNDTNFIVATRDSEGTYAMFYFPTGKTTHLDFSMLEGSKFNSWWFNPRKGNVYKGPLFNKTKNTKIEPPAFGKGQDWVLVVDNLLTEYGNLENRRQQQGKPINGVDSTNRTRM